MSVLKSKFIVVRILDKYRASYRSVSTMAQEKHKDEVLSLIEQYSTKKYFIEHHKYKSNHMSHGIVALHNLGAKPDRILKYVQRYSEKIEPAEEHGFDSSEYKKIKQTGLTNEKLESLKGERKDYYKLLPYYEYLLENKYTGNREQIAKDVVLSMRDGIHVAALHPLIELGYGLDIGSDVMVTEGLAYLHFSYMPHAKVSVDTAKECKDVLKVLEDVRLDDTLYDMMIEKAKEKSFMPWYTGSYQRKLGKLLLDDECFSKVLKYVKSIKYPSWFTSLSDEARTKDQMLKLMFWALENAITVYSCAEKRNDFFLLHGVTSGWALIQVLNTLSKPDDIMTCVEYFMCILLGTYLAQDKPRIHLNYLEEAKLDDVFLENLCKEAEDLETDEHVYKLVHVCNDLYRNKHCDNEKLLKFACRVSMDHKF